MALQARDDALPESGGTLLAGDGGDGAEHAPVLGQLCAGAPGGGLLLQLEPHFGGVERDSANLGKEKANADAI